MKTNDIPWRTATPPPLKWRIVLLIFPVSSFGTLRGETSRPEEFTRFWRVHHWIYQSEDYRESQREVDEWKNMPKRLMSILFLHPMMFIYPTVTQIKRRIRGRNRAMHISLIISYSFELFGILHSIVFFYSKTIEQDMGIHPSSFWGSAQRGKDCF